MPSYEPESQAEQEEHTKKRILKMYPMVKCMQLIFCAK
ncbi:DNA mismatch repair protein [Listeria monocytogenes serotype 4b str. H7858]|nr:DNA mismatch repair protein [Listeria monocytogenes serotype 4b str. H7858]